MLCSLISNYSWVMACLFGDKEWLRMLHKTFESLSGFGRNSWVHTDTARSPAESIWFDTVGDFLHEWKSVCVCLTSLRHGVYGIDRHRSYSFMMRAALGAVRPTRRLRSSRWWSSRGLVRDLMLTLPACDHRPLILCSGCYQMASWRYR